MVGFDDLGTGPNSGDRTRYEVEGDRTLVYGYDRLAVWYNGSSVENTFFVGDRSYRNDVFPKAWSPHQIKFTAQSWDGTVIISTTGPTGMAIIGLRWNP